jgi:hypothetical protein
MAYNQVAVAPDGVPVYQDDAGKYYTQNADQSYTQQFQGGTPSWLPGGGGTQAQAGQGPQMPQGIDPHLAQLYQQYGVTPGGSGSGFTDWNYWQNDALRNAGGDWNYITQRLGSDLAGTGPDQDPSRKFNPSGGPAMLNGGGYGGFEGMGRTGYGASPAELASYGQPANQYASAAYGGNWATPGPGGSLASQYTLPTQAELEATPGYQARLAQGLLAGNMSAAAKGSVLNGGTQKALARYGQDYASNEYANLVGQQLGARAQNQNEYQQNVVQPSQFAQTNQYRQYLDENNRTLNDYLTNYNINRQAIQDFLNQQNRTADRGLSAITAGRPAQMSY